MPRRIALLAFEAGQALDLVGPHDVFAAANDAVEKRGRARDGYELLVVAPTRRPVRMESGLRIVPDLGLDELPRSVDTLIVAGGRGARLAARNASVIGAVAKAARRVRRVAAVCTGSHSAFRA